MGSTSSRQKRSSSPSTTPSPAPVSPQPSPAPPQPQPSLAQPHTSSSSPKPSSLSSNPSPIKWEDAKSIALPRCILPLSSTTGHKGSSGRIGVLGGSARYTGAPYYAAMAALHVGVDLATVFCAEEATLPIKCYSPELMVTSVYRAADFDPIAEALEREGGGGGGGGGDDMDNIKEQYEKLVQRMVTEVVSMMDRLHVLIIGPGLGRCPLVMEATARIIQEARQRNLALVLDADALHLLTIKKYQTLLQGYPKAVLTPNRAEYQRLQKAMQPHDDDDNKEDVVAAAMNQALDQNILVIKGQHDEVLRMTAASNKEAGATPEEAIKSSSSSSLICGDEGGLKRSGGIGDILAGTLGTCVAWHEIMQKQEGDKEQDKKPSASSTANDEDWLVWSCWTACCIVKRATKLTFEIQRRSMTAPDILRQLGPTFDQMTTWPSPSRDRS